MANFEKGPKIETVDHPAHYKAGGIEAIDVIEAWELNFSLGSAVKYISRAGKKTLADGTKLDGLEDLQKAHWYLAREIERQLKNRK
jgi:hypothetical protein